MRLVSIKPNSVTLLCACAALPTTLMRATGINPALRWFFSLWPRSLRCRFIEPESNRKYARFIPGELPIRQSFGDTLTRVAVRTIYLPDASGLVNHRAGEGHETYLYTITECA